MKMTHLFPLFLFSCLTAQTVDSLIKVGITYHDQGKYDQAIEHYQQALALDSTSSWAIYELSYSYFAKKDYTTSIIYADKVIAKNDRNLLSAIINKGNALDLLGRTDESIRLFKETITEKGTHYLLYYNLAINYYKMDSLQQTKYYALNALDVNPNHASSHFLVADVQNRYGQRIPTLLGLYYFLFIESTSMRSKLAYRLLIDNLNKSVEKVDDGNFNITIAAPTDSTFTTTDLMLALTEASNLLKNKDKTEIELFIQQTKSFFNIVTEFSSQSKNDIYSDFYIPFYRELSQSQHLDTFCNYISQSTNDDARKWVEANPKRLEELSNWLDELNKKENSD